MTGHSCATCRHYERDFGTWTFNGWTKMDRNEGECRLNPPTERGWPKVQGSDRCGSFERERER